MAHPDPGNKLDMTEDEDRDNDESQGAERSPDDEPEPEPKPGLTAPLDDLTEEEERMKSSGVLPGAGPDRAEELAGKKREHEREGKPWGWEDEEAEDAE